MITQLCVIVFCLPRRPARLGEAYLDNLDVDYEDNWDLWQNIVALLCMTVILLTGAYIQLRRVNKYK